MPRPSPYLRYTTWPQRGDPRISPDATWDRGRPLDITHAPQGLARVPGHDEARSDPKTGTVLWLRDDTLTTCYARTRRTNDHGAAALEAVHAQYGPINEAGVESLL